jgi:hypothetical protein
MFVCNSQCKQIRRMWDFKLQNGFLIRQLMMMHKYILFAKKFDAHYRACRGQIT